MNAVSRVRAFFAQWGVQTAPYSEIEGAARRAAALVRGGASTTRVWVLLAEEAAVSADGAAGGGASSSRLNGIAERIVEGCSSSESLAEADGAEWRVLAAVWRMAEISGAPLAAMLDRFAHAMHTLGQVGERRSVLLSAPRSTIRLVASLPVVAATLGGLLGFDTWGSLATPLGAVTVVGGVALLALGVYWASVMTRRVSMTDWVAGWEFELAAIGVGGGSPPQTALRRVADCADSCRAEWVRLEELCGSGAVLRLITTAEQLGTQLGPMLLGEAEAARARAQADLERAAEQLGVRVLLPLGACVLPAFVLLGVVPVLTAVAGGIMG